MTCVFYAVFFFNDTATTEIYTLSLHDALPIYVSFLMGLRPRKRWKNTGLCANSSGSKPIPRVAGRGRTPKRSEEHTSELQSRLHLVCRLLLEKKKTLIATVYRMLTDAITDLCS